MSTLPGADEHRIGVHGDPHAPGREQLGAEDHPRRQHPRARRRAPRSLPHSQPVLQRDDHTVRGQQRRHRRRHRRGVVRLDRQQHGVERAAGRRRRASASPKSPARCSPHRPSMRRPWRPNGVEVRGAPEQRHVAPASRRKPPNTDPRAPAPATNTRCGMGRVIAACISDRNLTVLMNQADQPQRDREHREEHL